MPITRLATPYVPWCITNPKYHGSLILLHQFKFPYQYAGSEQFLSTTQEQLEALSSAFLTRVVRHHTGKEIREIVRWTIDDSTGAMRHHLVADLFEQSAAEWTGSRILARTSPGQLAPQFEFELFRRDQESETALYTGFLGENVIHRVCLDD